MMFKAVIVFLAIGMIISNQFQFTAASTLFHNHKILKRVNGDQNFIDFVEKMSKTERILKGITLYNEILEGTASREIGKLLGLSSIGLQELVQFETWHYKSVLTRLQSTMNNYVKNTKDSAEVFIELKKLKELLKTPIDLNNLPTDLTALDEVESIDLSSLMSFDIQKTIDELRNRNFAMYSSIQNDLQNCEGEVQRAAALKFDDVIALLESMDSLEKYRRIVTETKSLSAVKGLKQEAVADLKTNIGVVSEILNANLETSGFRTLQEVTKSLYAINSHTGNLKSLTTLVGETWFQSAVGNVVLQGLGELESLSTDLENVNDKWRTEINKAMIQNTKIGGELHGALKSTEALADTVLTELFSAVEQCTIPNLDPLFDNLGALFPFLVLRKVRALQKIVNISIPTLSSSPTDSEVVNVIQQLEKLRIHFATLKLGDKLQEHVTKLKSKSYFIANFKGDLNVGKHEQTLSCVLNLPDSLEKVAASAEVVKLLDQIDSSFFTDINSTITDLMKSTVEIGNVKSKLSAFPRNTELQRLLAIVPAAQRFSKAMEAVFAIQRASAENAAFQQFLDLGHLMDEYLSKTPNSETFREIMESWGDFENVEKSKMQTMISGIRNRIVGTPLPSGPLLIDFAPIFTAFKGLGDVDFSRKLKVFEKIFMGSPVDQLSLPVTQLAALDLKFSKFDSALSNIQSVLEKIRQMLQPIVTVTPPTSEMTRPQGTFETKRRSTRRATSTRKSTTGNGDLRRVGGTESSKQATEGNSYLTPTLIGVGGVLFLFGLAVAAYLMYRNHKKDNVHKVSKIKKGQGKKTKPNSGSEPFDSDPDDLTKSPTVAKLSKELVDQPNDLLKSPPEEGEKEKEKEREKEKDHIIGSKEAVWV